MALPDFLVEVVAEDAVPLPDFRVAIVDANAAPDYVYSVNVAPRLPDFRVAIVDASAAPDFRVTGITGGGGTASAILIETGDYLLLESGERLLMD